MKPWFRRFLPLALLLLQVVVVQAWGTSANTPHSSYPHARSSTRTHDGEVWPGDEHVHAALKILRDSKITAVQPDKPSGFLGYSLHYAQLAFRVLFLNGPQSNTPQRRVHPNVAKAVRELELAVEEDNPDAIFLLADMNFHGNFTHPRDFKLAFQWYQKLAKLTGNTTAQYMMGFMYGTGIGGSVERDQALSLVYHIFAAEGGDTRSQMTLGYRFHSGIGVPRSCDESNYYYKKVADKAINYYRSGPPGGNTMTRESFRWADEEGGVYGEGASVSSSGPNALRDGSGAEASLEDILEYLDLMSRKGELRATISLGKMHYEGAHGLPRNFRKAMKYFKTVTKKYWNKDGTVNPNHPTGTAKLAAKAAGHVGMMYLRGEGVEQNFGTALTWFKRGLASGDALCQHEIGLMHLHGYGVSKDAFKAASYFKWSADQDFPAAQTRLGALFLDQGDVATATRYFELAARWGWMEAFYYLAELSNRGIGRQRHCGMASAYYKMVAERAEMIHSSFPESNAAFDNGDGERALIAAMMAAEQGYESAQSNVAYLLDEQNSVFSLNAILPWGGNVKPSLLRNAVLALMYWTRSAKQANIDALIKMGDYYLSGLGALADAEKASTCYHTAAEAHHSAQAYWNLGWMHENGIAVEQDFHMAKRYYDLALVANDEAYLPVKLSLMKLRMRGYWNRITNGKINPIQEEESSRPRRSFKEWITAFIQNDAQEENQRAHMYKHANGEEEDLLSANQLEGENAHEDGYYDELELDIDESLLEGLIIVTLAATLAVLVYMRQQRNRQRQNENAGGGGGAQGAANGGDRGMFPRPGDPEFAQWVAGGVGH